MEVPSKILEEAVGQFAKLPGIGKRTALRLALHVLKLEDKDIDKFTASLLRLKSHLLFCKECHNISDEEICSICSDATRDNNILCIVEDLRDVIAVENTNYFRGKYHVLGGLISPMDGISPEHLEMDSLFSRLNSGNIREVIFALSPTMEGDTTCFYISRKISGTPLKITTLSRGVSVGTELEYADEVTLGRSLAERIPYMV